MKKLLVLFFISCGVIHAQNAYPYVQRNKLLTSGRVPYATTSGIVTDSSAFTFNSGTGALSATSFAGLLTSATGLVATTGLTATGTKDATTFLRGDNTWAVPAGGGSGTVTVVSSGSLTSTALVTGGGTTTLQTPATTATMDSSGNISTPGTLTVGNAATTAGAIALTQGTTQTAGTTNITLQAPAAVTSYIRTLPGAAATGFYLGTNSAGVVTDTQVASTGSGNVVLATSPTLVTPALGTPSALVLTNATGLNVAGGGTGRATGTTAYALVATGTTATGAQQTLASGATTTILVGGGASALPVWTTATGTGAPVRATNPTLTSPKYTVAAVGALAIDWNAGDYFTKTLSANSTFTFSNAATGKQIVVAVTNTASNYTVLWPTVSWSGGTAPTQTVGAKTDIYTFIQIGSTIYGSVVQNF